MDLTYLNQYQSDDNEGYTSGWDHDVVRLCDTGHAPMTDSRNGSGWGEQRFAGRGAAYGNAELRVRLGRPILVVPSDVGVFGLTDVGRVFEAGERSSTWHTGVGGGVWIAPLRRSNTLSLAVARGPERTGLYLRSGFLF